MKRIAIIVLLVAGSATGAAALEAKATKESTAPAQKAWATVGDFCGIGSWHPAVTKCVLSEKDGKTFRTLTLKDGGQLLERLVSRDDAAMSYTYAIEQGPLPVAGYLSKLKVVPNGSASTFEWTGSFDANGASAADAVKTITGIYEAGLSELAKKAAEKK